jgi:hypothetical protein
MTTRHQDALEKPCSIVTEVSSGPAPELKVLNAPRSLLSFSTERSCRAKQNRVLNTTILIKEKSETVIR